MAPATRFNKQPCLGVSQPTPSKVRVGWHTRNKVVYQSVRPWRTQIGTPRKARKTRGFLEGASRKARETRAFFEGASRKQRKTRGFSRAGAGNFNPDDHQKTLKRGYTLKGTSQPATKYCTLQSIARSKASHAPRHYTCSGPGKETSGYIISCGYI